MTKSDFYSEKSVTHTEWWLCSCSLPELVWARLRVFTDSTADACWSNGTTLYGFDARDYAGYFLAEDEYISFRDWDTEDERDTGVIAAEVQTPKWADAPDQPFEYVGTY